MLLSVLFEILLLRISIILLLCFGLRCRWKTYRFVFKKNVLPLKFYQYLLELCTVMKKWNRNIWKKNSLFFHQNGLNTNREYGDTLTAIVVVIDAHSKYLTMYLLRLVKAYDILFDIDTVDNAISCIKIYECNMLFNTLGSTSHRDSNFPILFIRNTKHF